MVTGRDDFYINGVSARTVGLVVDNLQPPPMAQQRHTIWSTGIDADSYQDDDVFDDMEYIIPARVLCKPSDFDNSDLYAFLQAAKTLQLSKLAGKYFKVRAVAGITPSATMRGNEITYSIRLILAPFKYHLDNAEVSPTNGIVTNPGTRYSRPVYKITHSGACTLTVNGQVLKLEAVGITPPPSPFYVDAERMIAYDSNGMNQTKHTTGAFPFLQPGTNTVSTTGSAVTIVGNWRDY